MREYLDSPEFLNIVGNSATKIQRIPNSNDMPFSAKKDQRPKAFSLLSPQQSTLKRSLTLPPALAPAIEQVIAANIQPLPIMPLAQIYNLNQNNIPEQRIYDGAENQRNLGNQGNIISPPRKKSNSSRSSRAH